ncbi:MAG: hypothetical protein L0Y72_02835 [Gemmataceae bacterium]|nr:hypothetical protein [Gemmataceae bacterium]MCI0737953.1 hypothetical protein [Gemmataceae bacterium]
MRVAHDLADAAKDALDATIRDGVLLPFREEVETFLVAHPQTAEVIPEVCGGVREFFGPDVEMSLELYKDPEFGTRELTLYVRMAVYQKEIMNRIDESCEPYARKLQELAGEFLVTTDFCTPRGRHGV